MLTSIRASLTVDQFQVKRSLPVVAILLFSASSVSLGSDARPDQAHSRLFSNLLLKRGHLKNDRVYINPETCIDCDACVPECPVEAIFSWDNVPNKYRAWIALNKKAKNYPVISEKKPALHGPSCKGPRESA